MTIILVFCGCREKKSNEEKVVQWLEKCRPVQNPSRWPPEAFTYDSTEEWAQAGRRIDGVEDSLIAFYENNTSGRPIWMIVYALGWVGSESAVPTLIRVLENEAHNVVVRSMAAEALARIGSLAAVEPLCKIVSSMDSESADDHILKYSAISALGWIGDPKARTIVEQVLKDEQHTEGEKELLLEVLEELKQKQ